MSQPHFKWKLPKYGVKVRLLLNISNFWLHIHILHYKEFEKCNGKRETYMLKLTVNGQKLIICTNYCRLNIELNLKSICELLRYIYVNIRWVQVESTKILFNLFLIQISCFTKENIFIRIITWKYLRQTYFLKKKR